jgi:hypothetical protein
MESPLENKEQKNKRTKAANVYLTANVKVDSRPKEIHFHGSICGAAAWVSERVIFLVNLLVSILSHRAAWRYNIDDAWWQVYTWQSTGSADQ